MNTDPKVYFMENHPSELEYEATIRGFKLYASYNTAHGTKSVSITREFQNYYYTISCCESFTISVTRKASAIISDFQNFMECGRPHCNEDN